MSRVRKVKSRRDEKNESVTGASRSIAMCFGLGRRLKERERDLAKQVELAGFWIGAQAGMPVLLTYDYLAAFHYELYLF
jgi:hypothetical protein